MRKKLQAYLFWVLLIFLAVGLVYPPIGVVALTCMLAPVVIAPFKGRYWCGNFCPRGSFWDNVLARVSPQKPIPPFFRSKGFRIFMVLLIFTVFGVQMYYAWGDLAAIGMVFVRIILVTTLVGIGLAFVYHHRTWCSFCPMGTLASWLSAKPQPKPLAVSDACVGCKLCTTACPLQLSPYEAKGSKTGFVHSDCLKCSRCVEKCPKKALSFGQ
ncbi:4Fe-4S binding protein [Anaeroselena agilis]|uniref:4Fe-4S binding protein n=1 Tax=Anaeroselena agilis TaxID=3063788 RepID=A0ABU3P1L2_9FIRM|nr:4Fe-4S binding protein [Selenomonadales bacterium 4137-cl]